MTTNNAHAWVEVYFPTIGWVAFDPTPGRNVPLAGASSTSPGFVNPFSGPATPGDTTVTTAPPATSARPRRRPARCRRRPAQSWLSRATWLPWVLGLVVIIAGWPFVRDAVAAPAASSRDVRQAAAGLLRYSCRATCAISGLTSTPAQTLDEVVEGIRRHVGLQPEPGLVDRADAILFGGRRARHQDLEQAESFRRSVNARLRKRHGWLRTAFAWYGVPRHALLRYNALP